MVCPSAAISTPAGNTPGVSMSPMAGRPMDKAMGSPKAISRNNRANRMMTVMTAAVQKWLPYPPERAR